jgi:NADH-quinone oxidoreductase subunit J
MGEQLAFYALSALILGCAVLVITARSTVYAILFLVLDFLFVAGLYVVLHAQFVAAIQVLVYAGGIIILYLFVVMLVNLKRPPEAHRDRRRRSRLGVVLSAVVLVEFAAIALYGYVKPPAGAAEGGLSFANVERVGWLLYTDYLVPFELASMLLLVAMIGAIVLARREL